MKTPPDLPKSLFGFSRGATRDLVAHFDAELEGLRARVTDLEATLDKRDEEIQLLAREESDRERQRQELEQKVRALEEELDRRQREIQGVREDLSASAAATELAMREPSDFIRQIITDELSPILAAAESAAARILERAEATEDLRVRRADALTGRLRLQSDRFHRWWERIEPVFRGVQSKLEELSAVVDEVPGRIQAALMPLSDSVTAIQTDLDEARSAAAPPSESIPLDFRPVTPELWGDLQRLFGPEGAFSGCWCMQWRLLPDQWTAQLGEMNREALHDLVRSSRVPGLLGYVDSEPVAWCSVGPRSDFPALETIPGVPEPDGEGPIWSVVCFFVAEQFRDKGLMKPMLDAAVDYARSQGARVVEGYPVEPAGELTPPLGITGVVTVFHRAGFQEVARPSEHQSVMRLAVEGHPEQPAAP